MTVTGVQMPNVAGDTAAFVLATSSTCTTLVASSGVSNTGSGINLTAVVSTVSAASGGVLRLCARWTSTSPYFDAGVVNVVAVASVVPSTLPVFSTALTVTLNGAGLANVNGDPAGYVVAAACPTASPTSVVTSTSSTFGTTSQSTLSIVDGASSAGAYKICHRTSATAPYFDLGVTLTIGDVHSRAV